MLDRIGPTLLFAAIGVATAVGCAIDTDGSGARLNRGSGDDDDSASLNPKTFTCDPKQKGPIDQLRLLTTLQYTNTLGDLAAWALHDEAAARAVESEIAPAVAQMQENIPSVPSVDPLLAGLFPDGGYHRADQEQQLLRVQAYYMIGSAFGAALAKAGRLDKVVGTCATDGDAANDEACIETFIRSFGARALRRPMTDDDVAFYQGVYGATKTAAPAAYADVIAAMLNAPDFVYLVEHGDEPVSGVPGTYTLSAYELASRLSYQLWDTMPDEELWKAAADGSLLDDGTYAKQVDRLFADPRAALVFDRFFADYLQVNGTGGSRGKGGINYRNPAAYVEDPTYKAFAGSNLPSGALGASMVEDALGMIDWFVRKKPGTVVDLLTSELSFAKSPELASIYGVAPWDGQSTPPSLPSGQRPGLFTRALVVSNGLHSNPIMKGVYLRRYVLCDPVGKPPPEAIGAVVEQKENQTTREAVTALTGSGGCAGCHATTINPLGFATESFDGLGRFRAAQTLFHDDGSVAGTLPIDTSSVPRVDPEDDVTKVNGAADLMKVVAESRKFEACLTRNYFRYAFARFEDLKLDGCTLESMRTKIDRSQGPGLLVDWLKQVVFTPAFKQRTFE